MNASLSPEDARAIVKLLGEICALPDDHVGKKKYLMDGLAALVDADYWAWVIAAELEPGKFPVYVGFLSGGFTETELAEFLQIQAHPEMIRWTIPLATTMRAAGRHVTRNVQDQFDYHEFITSEVGRWWSRAGVEPRCIAFHPFPDGTATGIGLYRKTGRPLFTDREAQIMHILLTEVPWLHELGWPEDRGTKIPELSPRCWLVHELLLQSYSRDQIASHLGISLHTVNDYVKAIYRHVGVNSHAELIARFYQGDGAHRP